MKRLALMAGIATAALSLAACGSGSGGQPEPAGQPQSAPSAASSANGGQDSSTANAGGGLASLNACTLLTASDATSLGLPSSGTKSNVGDKSGCQWDGSQFSVGVDVRTDVGLAGVQANGGTVTDTKIGNHAAKQVDTAGGCTIAVGVTNSSRVDTEATGNSQAGQCNEALAVAKLVEKKLPSS